MESTKKGCWALRTVTKKNNIYYHYFNPLMTKDYDIYMSRKLQRCFQTKISQWNWQDLWQNWHFWLHILFKKTRKVAKVSLTFVCLFDTRSNIIEDVLVPVGQSISLNPFLYLFLKLTNQKWLDDRNQSVMESASGLNNGWILFQGGCFLLRSRHRSCIMPALITDGVLVWGCWMKPGQRGLHTQFPWMRSCVR